MSSSSREPRADAMFSLTIEPTLNTFSVRNRSNEPGDQFESSVHSVNLICSSIKIEKISSSR